MRLLLVFPGPLYSTIDLANGYFRAFKKVEGLELFTFQFHKNLVYHDYAQKFMFGLEYDPNKAVQEAAKDILVRILECRADCVIFISGIGFPTNVWEYVKQLQGDLKRQFKIGVILTESPYVEEWESGILERVDFAFTTDYGIIDKYKEVNQNLHYLKHAFDTSVHYRADDPRDIDVFMVGTGFPERQRLLETVNWDGIGLELYGNWMYMGESPLRKYLVGENLKNEETADKYRRAKIALNIFRTVKWPDNDPKFIEPNLAKSLSPRVYEAMACGACLLTDWREELATLPEDSYVLWGNGKELEEKTRWLLANPEECSRIAENGYRVIQGEDFDKRAQTILEKI